MMLRDNITWLLAGGEGGNDCELGMRPDILIYRPSGAANLKVTTRVNKVPFLGAGFGPISGTLF